MVKLLIIEDEQIIRQDIVRKIDQIDLKINEIYEANDGKKAIEIIQKVQPQIVLLDINVPIFNGLEILEQTYEKYHYQTIIISGYADFEFAQAAIRYNVVDYLLKPVLKTQVNTAIKQALALITNKEVDYGNSYSDYTNRVLKYIQQNLKNQISLKDISQNIGISADHLNRVFKYDTGDTVRQKIIEVRIEKAKEYLLLTENKVYEIADMVGFRDYKYFFKVFKEIVGCSPIQYRKDKKI